MDSLILESGNYSIVCSLNERSIYLKITDNIGFLQYESNIDSKELRLNIDLSDAFMIIKHCFEEEEGYEVKFTHTTDTLKLQFNALVGGFLKMKFDIYLKERVMSNDGQLTMTLNKLEQKINGLEKQLHKKYEMLEDLTEKLSYSMIYLGCGGGFQINLNVFMNIKTLTLDQCQCVNFNLIQYLYQLNELTLSSNYTYSSITFSSKTLTDLKIYNSGHLTSVHSINNIPQLKKLYVLECRALTNIPSILSSYDHKIKQLIFQGCTSINVVEMQTYCQKNHIQLDIK